MKKINLILVLFTLIFTISSFTKADTFFLGKWEILVVGTPQGDVKFATDIIRKEDGKLECALKVVGADPNAEAIPVSNIEEESEKITLYFSAQGYDLSLELTKGEDPDKLKGSLMGMFDAQAVRLKE